MSMNRFLCLDHDHFSEGQTVHLTTDDSRHAQRVLRIREGESVGILNGAGWVAEGRFMAAPSGVCGVRVASVRQYPRPGRAVHLVLSMLKNKAMDTALQKAVETGVSHIWPIATGHCEVRLKDVADKLEKWKKIIHESQKQSGNPWTPDLHQPMDFKDTLNNAEGILNGPQVTILTASLQENASPIMSVPLLQGDVVVWVGPEGDFTESEYLSMKAEGIHPVKIGPHVMRSETAVTVACSILRARLDAPGVMGQSLQ